MDASNTSIYYYSNTTSLSIMKGLKIVSLNTYNGIKCHKLLYKTMKSV